MAKQTLTAGLDIGSNKVCCVAGVRDEEARLVKILGAASIPCEGIKAGAVIDIQEAAVSIGKALEESEKAAGGQIENIIIALRGNFVRSKDAKGVANINHSNREITQETVENALESARKQIEIDSGQEIIQIVPREYILNQQKGIQNPVGMEGTFIEVDVHAFVASSSNMGNIMKAMKSIGVNCDDKVYGYLAASDILVTKEDRELGCLVVDFGGLTTGLVHYVDGVVGHTDEIYEGSDYITRDIGHKLRASYSVSKDIKEKYGAAFVYEGFISKEFEYGGADGRSTRKYESLKLVNGVIMPRIDRILYEIKGVMERNNYGDEFLAGGIILTGGGSKLPGLAEAFERAFNCSVKTGVLSSDKIICPNEEIVSGSYTAAIGAIAFNFLNLKGYSQSKSSGGGIVSKILRWFEEVF